MLDQVYYTLLREEVRHTLAPQDPCFVEVHVQVPRDNGVPEVLQGFLKVRQMFQHRGWQVFYDDQGSSESDYYLAAYHVRPVVARGLNPPPRGFVPHHYPNAAQSSPSTGRTRHQTSHIVSETIMSVGLQLYFSLGQQHHVKTPAFHRTDGLRHPKAPAIPDV